MSRSAKGFCHGLCGAVTTSSIRMPFNALPELLAVDSVTVAQEIGGRGVVRESVHDLLGGPVGGGVLGHVEVEDAPAVVSEHDENKEDTQARGGDREEIDGDQMTDMVGEERPPGLGWGSASLR